MRQVTVVGTTINDVWFKAIKAAMEHGREYVIDKGEYEGQKRKEFDLAILHVRSPGIRPLACQSQTITPTSDEKIDSYFKNYILDPYFTDSAEMQANEYKYSTWIAPQWQRCCDLLRHGKGGCNQATITLGKGPGDPSPFTHPPCMRVIDMRICDDKLHFFVYFRSWDLVSGLPENMGGLQLLKEMCLTYLNSHDAGLKDGSLIGISKGLHIYDHYWDIAKEYAGEYVDLGINVLTV